VVVFQISWQDRFNTGNPNNYALPQETHRAGPNGRKQRSSFRLINQKNHTRFKTSIRWIFKICKYVIPRMKLTNWKNSSCISLCVWVTCVKYGGCFIAAVRHDLSWLIDLKNCHWKTTGYVNFTPQSKKLFFWGWFYSWKAENVEKTGYFKSVLFGIQRRSVLFLQCTHIATSAECVSF